MALQALDAPRHEILGVLAQRAPLPAGRCRARRRCSTGAGRAPCAGGSRGRRGGPGSRPCRSTPAEWSASRSAPPPPPWRWPPAPGARGRQGRVRRSGPRRSGARRGRPARAPGRARRRTRAATARPATRRSAARGTPRRWPAAGAGRRRWPAAAAARGWRRTSSAPHPGARPGLPGAAAGLGHRLAAPARRGRSPRPARRTSAASSGCPVFSRPRESSSCTARRVSDRNASSRSPGSPGSVSS